jgi:LacI family transcriptional regulator
VAIFNQRLRGYLDALKANNLPIDEDLLILGKVTIESGRDCTNALLARAETPDAIFTVEDFTALGAMQALKDAGKKIPEDVAIVGFANEPFGKYITPSLSTVDQQATKMGEEAAKLFFDLPEKNNFYEQRPPKIILEPALILRSSSLKHHQ